MVPHAFLFRRISASRHFWVGGRATPFPFWPKIRECWGFEKWQGGCATSFPFSPKIRESALLHAEVAPPTFLFRRVVKNGRGSATRLPFSPKIRESGLFLPPQKASHVVFRLQKASHMEAHEQKREQKRELLRPRNVSTPPSDCTALRPFSPSLMRLAYDP